MAVFIEHSCVKHWANCLPYNRTQTLKLNYLSLYPSSCTDWICNCG